MEKEQCNKGVLSKVVGSGGPTSGNFGGPKEDHMENISAARK